MATPGKSSLPHQSRSDRVGRVTAYHRVRYPSACGRLELFARDYPGEGPALLLMHGLTRNSADFEPLAAHLAGDYRLIVPDQRGRGLSPWDNDPANYRPDIYARDMLALLDFLEIERAPVIGTSMGGIIAMTMAAMAPERIGPVVLNDIGPDIATEGLARIASYVGPSVPFPNWQKAARHCEQVHAEALPGLSAAQWLEFAQRTCCETEDGQIAFAYDPAIAIAFDPANADAPVDLWPAFRALDSQPLLVLRGELSDLLNRSTVETMQRNHTGPFRSMEVPRRGHAPILDEPVALRAITSFLKEHVA